MGGPPERFRHFPQLDGLRGAAILLVVAGHVSAFGFGIERGLPLGGLGVMLFFVLSGFLITGLLDREKTNTGRVSLLLFYIRRAFRLFPALFCFLAVLSLLIHWGAVTDTPWATIVSCLIYLRNLWGRGSSSGHIWSLSIEEQFYLFWPCVVVALSRRGALWTACAGVISISAFRMAAIHYQLLEYSAGLFYKQSWFRFDSLLIGCAIAFWFLHSGLAARVGSYLTGFTTALVLWASALLWTVWGEDVSPVWYLTVQMMLAALILLNAVLSRSPVYLAILSHPVAAWFGRISYSWYLWQQLFTVFRTPSWYGLRTVPVNIVVSLLIAAASYHLVELPFLRLRERFSPATAKIDKNSRIAG